VAAAEQPGPRQGSRLAAWGGMLAALILFFLSLSAWSPTADLAFFSMTSLAVAIAVIEMSTKAAWLVYLASGLICLAWPGLAFAWPFLFFFGPYPLIRAWTDRKFAPVAARFLRLAAGTVLAILSVWLFAWPAVRDLADRFGILAWLAGLPGMIGVIVLYDIALGILLQFYGQRLRRH